MLALLARAPHAGERGRRGAPAPVRGRAGEAPAADRCGCRSTAPAPCGGSVRIEFERYLRRDRRRPALGTMLAIEGGPGFSTTDSRDSYLKLLAPLRARRDLLLVDLRGTGLSGALDCKTFRKDVQRYVARAGQCARGARAAARLLRDGQRGRRRRRGARRAADPAGRRLRRLLRLLRRAGVRGAPPGPAALARARRDLPGAGHRSGVRRPRRGDPARAAARVRAAAELRGARRGPGRGGRAAGGAAAGAAADRRAG